VPEARRWFDKTQPQTLQAAVLFSYINAALAFLTWITAGAGPWLLLLAVGFGANGIANDRRFGYRLAAICAVLYLFGQVIFFFLFSFSFSIVLNVLFASVLVALLLHPQSREYERIWFR
jgi:hypothetical protein